MRKPTLSLVGAITILLTGVPHVGARTFTSTDGVTIEAEVLSITGDNVVIKRVDSKIFNIPIAKFCEEDRKYFDEWSKQEAENKIPKLDVAVSSGRKKSSDPNGDYDDRKGSFQMSVTIENDERTFDLKGATAAVVSLGLSSQYRDEYAVFEKEIFKIDIPAGKTFKWEGKEVNYRYDDNPPVLSGHQYYGYVMVVKNSTGKTILVKSSNKKFEKNAEAVLNLNKKDQVNEELEKISRSGVYFGFD